MKAVKLIVAVTITALLAGCVVYPVGYGYRGGGYHGGHGGHGGHQHHHGGRWHHR